MDSLKTWNDLERARAALQTYSPRFSRAEVCRRAGISETTFFKGIQAGKTPTASRGSAVRRAIAEEAERLPPADRAQLELVIAAEKAMVDAGLRE